MHKDMAYYPSVCSVTCCSFSVLSTCHVEGGQGAEHDGQWETR